MRILFCSVPFAPSVGGIETVSALLAGEFVRAGHEVVLVTQTAAEDAEARPYRVVRRPGAARLLRLVREADCVFHNNISLRLAWPLLLVDRPWVVAHHTLLPRQGLAAAAKRWAMRLARNVSVSQAMAARLPVPSLEVPNPYRADLFRRLPDAPRERDLVFVGRLVSEKGVLLLLDALAQLAAHGPVPDLTVVGDGPERPVLEAHARQLGLRQHVRFAGPLAGEALVRCLNSHRAIVVPSVCEEAFGLVALEGLACGCLPIVAASGGLPQAAGPQALVFPRGDLQALVRTLAGWQDGRLGGPQAHARSAEHLALHEPRAVAARYLSILGHGLGNGSRLVAP